VQERLGRLDAIIVIFSHGPFLASARHERSRVLERPGRRRFKNLRDSITT
jgi:hypothetical protein